MPSAFSTIAITVFAAGWASAGAPAPSSTALTLAPGYLTSDARPDSLSFVPPPPEAGSAAQARDDAVAQAAEALQGSPRWRIATSDANLKLPQAAQAFACALGIEVTPKQAPVLLNLLNRSITDLGLSTYGVKTKYNRARPFTVDGAPICTPSLEADLRRDGSYPSGHSTIGWGWALILAEIAPDRADAILARGRAFGESRAICNVHWQSDIEEGRIVAAAVVAKLHSSPQFRYDLNIARSELTAMRQTGDASVPACATEATGLDTSDH